MALKFTESPEFSAALAENLAHLPGRDAVHLSVINLTPDPVYAGFQDTKLCYTASLPKLYVAMAVYDGVVRGVLALGQEVSVDERNWRQPDNDTPRSLAAALRIGVKATVQELLERMVTFSCDTSANLLIDLVTRERVNELIVKYGWRGSEVTRKFLPRPLEDPEYRDARPTAGCTRHLAECLYRVEVDGLDDRRVSSRVRELLERQLDKSKIGSVLPAESRFAHKTGWFESEVWSQLNCQGDCGIVRGPGYHYVVACVVNQPRTQGLLTLRKVGGLVHEMICG